METIEYRTEDKSEWDNGPWNDEPDKKQWLDEETGYPCLIVRNNGGALCGYVGVTEGHPAYNKDYNSVDVEVHGGLTFSDFCHKGAEETGICHKVDNEVKTYWLGFDCAHYQDVCPAYAASSKKLGFNSFREGTYKDFGFVTNQVRKLARQLKALEQSA